MQYTIDIQVLRALLPLAAEKDIRYYLNGVHVAFEATQTIYEATNGHILGRYVDDTQHNDVSDPVHIIVPREIVKQLKPHKKVAKGSLVEADGAWRVLNPASGQDIGFAPLDGNYPDLARAIPQEAALSNTPGHYNVRYLCAFADVNKAFGAPYDGNIHLMQNGEAGAALVKLCRPEFTGVIMPVRM